MAEQLNQVIQEQEIGHFLAEKAGALANLMSGSNGRDKICAIVQYTVHLYAVCMRHSDEYALLIYTSIGYGKKRIQVCRWQRGSWTAYRRGGRYSSF